MSTDPNKTETLFGGRTIVVNFNDGTTANVKVRQLPLADYEKAFSLIGDEMALTALICDQNKIWLLGDSKAEVPNPGVTPEAYELLQAAAMEVNKNGFFAWSARAAEKQRTQQIEALEIAQRLSPETLQRVTQLGVSALASGSKA